ncbi:alpha-glycosidase [Paractinoplanes deccanensis]|uniref:Alpha-glycosidase n=1 Tax=Paractinoplanes deccanensis TaxID=113561 RepID=A0ABQ3YI83_9ACTN|nr:glycoside hydrolase family 13 protein [Actinoplanes deccanensis]GID79719.1 alpha-glycosidase [Actinoplanes deccanensis]
MRPHHDGSELYVSDPAPALGDTVAVFVRVPRGTGVSRVHMRWVRDGEPVFTSAAVDRRGPGGDTWWRAELPVHNPVTSYRFLLGTTRGVRWLTGMGLTTHDVPDATDFRLVAHPPPPSWARDAVVYQIFPDRYARSAARELPAWAVGADWDDPVVRGPDTLRTLYGGDLDGIARHLDHVTGLGADTVYLTPFFPARSNHRYDATTFDHVDPLLGGDGALERLSAAARDRGLRLLGDLTTNHTGASHDWFPDDDLYYRRDDGGYESWLGVADLPKLNWGSAELRRRFRAVVQHWLAEPYALSGWRVDVANMTARHGADDRTHEVAAMLRRAVLDVRPDGLLIAEHAHDAGGDLDRDGWHGTMNYSGFTRPVWSWLRADDLPFDGFLGVPERMPRAGAEAVAATMTAFAAQMSWRSWTTSWQLLGSHDTARIRTVVGSRERHEVAAGLLFTLPGTPMVFAGDELGLTGANNEEARVPMRWDAPVLGCYPELIALRRSSPALSRGGLRWVHADGDSLVFLRESAAQSVLVLARRSPGRPLALAGLAPGASWENLYGGAKPLHTEPDGSTAIDGYGPAVQVWALNG